MERPQEDREKYWDWYIFDLENATDREDVVKWADHCTSGVMNHERWVKTLKIVNEKLGEPENPWEKNLILYLEARVSSSKLEEDAVKFIDNYKKK